MGNPLNYAWAWCGGGAREGEWVVEQLRGQIAKCGGRGSRAEKVGGCFVDGGGLEGYNGVKIAAAV